MFLSIEDLDPAFNAKLQALLARLEADNIHMRISTAIRTPEEQARLWRQSRARDEVASAVAHLKSGGAHWLAEVLEGVGPQYGPPVTRALPGLSWHQWGEAADLFWVVNGAAEWSVTRVIDGDNGYHALARAATEAGLTAGGNWPTLKDWPHVQLRPHSSPLEAGMTLQAIDAEMERRFAPAALRAAE
jgi:hypothetical protein